MSEVTGSAASTTVVAWTRSAADVLVAAGFSEIEARQDAGVLGRHVLGWDPATWIVRNTQRLPAAAIVQLNALVARRASREPVAYILGEREFHGLMFQVSPAVLIPRPETEFLVGQVHLHLDRLDPDSTKSPHVLDVGTGSGCIAVTLAVLHPNIRLTATDTSAAALEVARDNAARHRVADRITFIETDLAGTLDEALDVVVSNPPYVALSDRDGLSPDVRDFEPSSALFAGVDGLAVFDRLIPAARRLLAPNGLLAVEIGAGQREAVVARLTEHAFANIDVTPDLAGHPRVVSAHRRGVSV